MSQTTRPIPNPPGWETLPIHPLGQLVEYGAGVDVDAVAEQMRLCGYDGRESLVWYQNQLLDGRLRRASAIKAGITPTSCEFTGSDPVAFVRRKMLRQHLTVSQLAQFANKLANLNDTTAADAAKSVGVSERAVALAAVVENHGTKALQRAVRCGTIKVSDAAKVAKKSHVIQDYAVAEVQAKRARTALEAATLCHPCLKRVKKEQRPLDACPACIDLRVNGKPKATKKATKRKQLSPRERDKWWKRAQEHIEATLDMLQEAGKVLGLADNAEPMRLAGVLKDFAAEFAAWRGSV